MFLGKSRGNKQGEPGTHALPESSGEGKSSFCLASRSKR